MGKGDEMKLSNLVMLQALLEGDVRNCDARKIPLWRGLEDIGQVRYSGEDVLGLYHFPSTVSVPSHTSNPDSIRET